MQAHASKTEDERDVPLSKSIKRAIRARVRQGLTKSKSLSTDATITGSAFVFARATTATFDNTIARACLMEVTGNDAGTVMK